MLPDRLNPFRWRIFNPHDKAETVEAHDAATLADFRGTFQTMRGSRVLAIILREAGMFQMPLTDDRRNLDMLDGKRELAMTIMELAGFDLESMPKAMVADDLRQAKIITETDDEPDNDGPGRGYTDDPDDDIIIGD